MFSNGPRLDSTMTKNNDWVETGLSSILYRIVKSGGFYIGEAKLGPKAQGPQKD